MHFHIQTGYHVSRPHSSSSITCVLGKCTGVSPYPDPFQMLPLINTADSDLAVPVCSPLLGESRLISSSGYLDVSVPLFALV